MHIVTGFQIIFNFHAKPSTMKLVLLLVTFSLIIGCNSGKKEEKKVTEDTTKVSPPAVNPPGVDIQPAGKIDIESFGDIKLGQSSTELLKILGEPEVKSRAVEWGADGLIHQDWVWNPKGLEINISSEKGKEETTSTVFSIRSFAPCTYKTKAGIGIGSTYDEVHAAYKRDINAEESNRQQIVVGSVYGGIIFSFHNDKVENIFLGAAAE
jgi:hypothetical protein